MAVVVYLDANVLIALIEAEQEIIPQTRRLFTLIENEIVAAITSEVTLAEVLVKPLKNGDIPLLKSYESLLAKGSLVQLVAAGRGIWIDAAALRALHGLKLVDALHLATASRHGCDVLITADKRIKSVGRIRIIDPESSEMATWIDEQ